MSYRPQRKMNYDKNGFRILEDNAYVRLMQKWTGDYGLGYKNALIAYDYKSKRVNKPMDTEREHARRIVVPNEQNDEESENGVLWA